LSAVTSAATLTTDHVAARSPPPAIRSFDGAKMRHFAANGKPILGLDLVQIAEPL
jgi:hypothetical protein